MIYVLIGVIGILLIIIYEEKQNNKDLLKKYEEKLKALEKQNEILNNNKIEIVSLKNEIQASENKIKELNEELSNYTQIKNDSLILNVTDEDEIARYSEDKVTVEQKISETKSSELNAEKQEIYELIEKTNSNIFITGKAGTGKSYLLKYFRKNTIKKVLYCAPTGIAALNIDGVTLHSAFGWNNLIDEHEIKLSSNKLSLLRSIDTLIIDEISMVRVDVFNQIDKILKKANNNSKPFGGKQVIVFGDLFQLPPVAKREETEFFTDKYGGIFFFNAPAYKDSNFEFREITEIFRQTDKEFIDILNDIRVGKINEEQIKSLNQHYVTEVPRRVVQVVPMKNEANNINSENLNKINGQEFEYQANVLVGKDIIKETDFPCDFDLKLKVGALVMMITNDQEHKRWVNGTLGIISGLSPTMVKVTINGTDFEISPTTFNKYKCEYDRENKTLKYIVEASVSQFPLILAYAITIHKSQGMTYQQIACNLESCFAPGQAYVALSRCANYDKLYLTKKIDASSIITDNVVVNFYKDITKKGK